MQESAAPIDGRAARAARTREAIVDATVALVEEGDLRPTAPRIAERAGVSVRSVFQHFDDLPALHTAVVDRVVERLAEAGGAGRPGPAARRRASTTFVSHRADLLEAVTPFRRAAAVHGPFAPEIRERRRPGHRVPAQPRSPRRSPPRSTPRPRASGASCVDAAGRGDLVGRVGRPAGRGRRRSRPGRPRPLLRRCCRTGRLLRRAPDPRRVNRRALTGEWTGMDAVGEAAVAPPARGDAGADDRFDAFARRGAAGPRRLRLVADRATGRRRRTWRRRRSRPPGSAGSEVR